MDVPINFMLRFSENISPEINRIDESQQNLTRSTDFATQSIEKQRLAFVYEISVIRAFHAGISGGIRSMTMLGGVSEETAKKLMKVDAAVMLVSSGFQFLRGAKEVLVMLAGAEAQLAGIETYRAILKNPAMMGLAMAGVGLSAGIAGYLLGGGGKDDNSMNVTQNIAFTGYGYPDQRSMAGSALEVWG
jgi:hypothetical protein